MAQQLDPNLFQKQMTDNVNAELSTMPLDFEISERWYIAVQKAFHTESPMSAQLNANELKALKHKIYGRDNLNYLEFAICNNILERKSPKELGFDEYDAEYDEIMVEMTKFAEEWNKPYERLVERAKEKTIRALAPDAGGKNGKIRTMGEA